MPTGARAEPLTVVLRLLAVVVLVSLKGFFVAVEFALVRVRRTQMDEMVDQSASGAGRVRCALNDIDRFIAATQLGITMASLGLAAGRSGGGRTARTANRNRSITDQ